MIQANNQFIQNIENVMSNLIQKMIGESEEVFPSSFSFSQTNLLESDNCFEKLLRKTEICSKTTLPESSTGLSNPLKKNKEDFLCKLFSDFGENFGVEWKHKIVLDSQFPQKIYKNRKFDLKLKLVSCSGSSNKIVCNCKKLLIQKIL